MEKLNTLAKQQEIYAQQLLGLYEDAKKPSTSRLRSKLIADANKLWNQILAQDAKCNEIKLPEHPYHAQGYLQKIEQRYMKILQLATTEEQSSASLNSPQSSTTPEAPPQDSTPHTGLEIRTNEFNISLQRLYSQTLSIPQVMGWLNRVEEEWMALSNLYHKLMEMGQTVDRDIFETLFAKKNEAKAYLENLKVSEQSRENTRPNVPLPAKTIPQFNGGYQNWQNF